jgi:hypothetical protein
MRIGKMAGGGMKMQARNIKQLAMTVVLAFVLLFTVCVQGQAAAGGTAPAASKPAGKPVLTGEGINLVYHYSGSKITSYSMNDYLENTGATGSVEIKVSVKLSSGTAVLSKTKSFTAKAGKKYRISFDTGYNAGDTKGTSYVTISSANMDGSHQYELKKTLITSVGDIKVEEVKNNADLAKVEAYAEKQLLRLDGLGEGNYVAYVDAQTTSVDIAVTAKDPDATVAINGQSAKSTLKKAIALKMGENTVTVKITAPDGETSRTFVIKISRSSSTAGKKWSNSYASVSELAADKSGVIYAGVSSGSANALLALNPDGTVKWKYAAPNKVSCPVVGPDGSIYAFCGTKIIALSPAGKLKWQYDAGTYLNQKIVVGKDNNLYFGVFAGYTDEKYCAVSPAGKKMWEFKTGSVYSLFTVGTDNTFYYTTWDMQKKDNGYMLHALKPDRSVKWESDTSGSASCLAFGGGQNLYLSMANGKLLAVDTRDGSKIWEVSSESNDKFLKQFVVGQDGTIYIEGGAMLYAMDAGGLKRWETGFAEYLWGVSVSADNTVYVSSADHKIYAVDAKGARKKEFLTTGISVSAPVILPDGSVCASTDDNKIFGFGK